MFHYFPVLFNQATLKLSQSSKAINQNANPSDPLHPIEPNFNHFFPLVFYDQFQTDENPTEPIIETIFNKYKFYDFDFSPNAGVINIQINPKAHPFISDQPVEISFLPSTECVFGDGQACVYGFSSAKNNHVIIASIHSGFGGEAENFRNLIEGTGINQGLYSIDQVNQNIRNLIGSEVEIIQSTTVSSGLSLVAIARIPAEHLDTYYALPIEETISYAIDAGLLDPKILEEEIFVFETCGWQLPKEEQNPNYPKTTQSIYLGIIQ